MVRPIIPRDLDTTTAQPFPLPLPSPGQQPDLGLPSINNPNIRSRPLPGVRCPKCAENGKESWVLPGRSCSTCGTPCF